MKHRTFLLVNPRSGRGTIRNRLLNVIEVLSAADHQVTVYPTKARADATAVVAALSDEYDTIVCCGGDGTLNEVVTGMMHNPNTYELGYIPAGTLNEWSSGLKISRNAEKAAMDIVKRHMMPLDIGRFGEKYFVYTASFGAFTEASYAAPQEVKNILGQAAYFIQGIKSVGNIKPIPMRLVIDGKEYKDNFLFGTISNSMSVGGVVHFDETTVKLNDGLFEIFLIHNPSNLLEFNDILDGIVKKDLSRKCLDFIHASSVEIYTNSPINWTLDGEMASADGHITVQNLHSAVSFLVPEVAKNKHQPTNQ